MNPKSRSSFTFYTCVLVAVLVASCDIYKPQKTLRFAVPESDVIYRSMFSHIQPLLEKNGYKINVAYCDRNIDAIKLVAGGKADLAFINNISSHILQALGPESAHLRTILPLTRRALMGYSREFVA